MAVVLITGASSGIGRACAAYLHERGHKVYGASRSCPRADLPFPTIGLDVNDDESVRRCVATVLDRETRLDVVVNCAGFIQVGAVEDTAIEEAKAQFETNFFGTVRVCRAALPTMRQQRVGLIVNISSIAGILGIPFQPFYSASKFALEGMTEALRLEVAPFGVRVVLIEPGDFHTANRREWSVQALETTSYKERLERLLDVMKRDEVAGGPPLPVARCLERIMRARRPRTRYVVAPWYLRLPLAVKALIPAVVSERLLARYYGID